MQLALALLLTLGSGTEPSAPAPAPVPTPNTSAGDDDFWEEPRYTHDRVHWMSARYDYGAAVSRYGLGYSQGPFTLLSFHPPASALLAFGPDIAVSTLGHHAIDAVHLIARLRLKASIFGLETALALSRAEEFQTSFQIGPSADFIFGNLGVLLEVPIAPLARPYWMPVAMLACRIHIPLKFTKVYSK